MNPSPGPWRWALARYLPHSTYVGDIAKLVTADDKELAKTTTGNADDMRLIAAAPEMREMLLKLEWAGLEPDSDGSVYSCCPHCEAIKGTTCKHKPDCDLAALLERLR